MAIQRQTESVKTVWKTFEKSENALSVVALVKKFEKTMNKTTVYRILDRFEKEGMLHSFVGKDGLKWYAKCHDCSSEEHIDVHPHFQCNNCGKVECLSVEVKIPPITKHAVKTSQILLFGECENCL